MYSHYLVKHYPYPLIAMAGGNRDDALEILKWTGVSVACSDDANTNSLWDDVVWDKYEGGPPCGWTGTPSIRPLSN